MSAAKVAFVLIDGLADCTYAELDGRTPLQRASMPFTRTVAAGATMGLMDPVEPGLACGSDTAHLNIFGYDPRKHYRGRGCFESLGSGLDMIVGDIAFKSNFATLEPASSVVLLRRADRNFEELGPVLCAYLDGMRVPGFPGYEVAVKYATEHRCAVRIRGPGLSDAITGTDPLKDNLPLVVCEPTDGSPEAAFTSRLVNALSLEIHRMLEVHPINEQRRAAGKNAANVVLLRGAGVRIQVQPFAERYGMRGFMVAPTAIIAGLGTCIGLDIVRAPGATGDYHSDWASKGRTFAATLCSGEYDFGFLHFKAIDDAGHDFNLDLKVSLLERFDGVFRDVVRHLDAHLGAPYVLVLTGDHSTLVSYGDHSYEPVPFMIATSEALHAAISAPTARTAAFDEIACGRGALSRFPGSQVMSIVSHFRALASAHASP